MKIFSQFSPITVSNVHIYVGTEYTIEQRKAYTRNYITELSTDMANSKIFPSRKSSRLKFLSALWKLKSSFILPFFLVLRVSFSHIGSCGIKRTTTSTLSLPAFFLLKLWYAYNHDMKSDITLLLLSFI